MGRRPGVQNRRQDVRLAAPLSPARIALSFKCTPEEFAELTQRPGIIPAPYAARSHWVALETYQAMPPAEIKRRLSRSYELVFAKLPKKTQLELSSEVKSQPPAPDAAPKRTATIRAAKGSHK